MIMSKEINVNDLTIGQVRELQGLLRPPVAEAVSCTDDREGEGGEFEVGRTYFVRTVTFAFVGTVQKVTESALYLNPSVWIADTGLFYDFLKNGCDNSVEVEPYPDGNVVRLRSIIDSAEWAHEMPKLHR